jgi:hypothetical protein
MPKVPTQAMISQHSPSEVGEPLFRQMLEETMPDLMPMHGDGSEQHDAMHYDGHDQHGAMHGSSAEENGQPGNTVSGRLSEQSHHSHLNEVRSI